MDQEVVIGTGLTLIFAFARWRFPAVPNRISEAGLLAGISIIVGGIIMPQLNLGWPVLLLFTAGFLFIGGAFHLALKEKVPKRSPAIAVGAPPTPDAQGGKGGSGEIFGNNGTIIGGKGGSVGPGGVGHGGDGGGGIIHGDGGTIIGGEGGSVDGTNIWFPPAQSAYIQFLESQGQTPDFGVQYPGAGGASGGWLQRQQVVAQIREEYFKKLGQAAKLQSSKIEDVPLEYVNQRLKEYGHPWRARIEKKYWYLYYIP